MPKADPKPVPTVRCAIYTRKSTEEGLSQEFTSLDAQREAGEAYIASQRHAGWVLRPERYDDGGYSGGDMDRPALQRLLADVAAGRLDCAVVYKVDRLSRSLLDFARMIEIFDRHQVSVVSVTQQFQTTTSLGRLTLNILLSFAQFERELIGERTRDKMSAARRKGKWVGGIPVLGYDVDPRGGRLVVNAEEARRVEKIFDLYLRHGGLIPTVRELNRLGWATKQWTTRNGRPHPGRPFTKNALFRLLTNVLYTGQVNHKGQVYPGEHAAIVPRKLWERAQAVLRENGRSGGREVRNLGGGILKGVLHCGSCGSAMLHTYTVRRGRCYRYYVCLTAQQRGWAACATKSVSAQEIESSVLRRVRGLGADPRVVAETYRAVQRAHAEEVAQRHAAVREKRRECERLKAELLRLAGSGAQGSQGDERLRECERQATEAGKALEELSADRARAEARHVEEGEVAAALRAFDPVWTSLRSEEQAAAIRTLIERIDYHGPQGRVAVRFHSAGLAVLGLEHAG